MKQNGKEDFSNEELKRKWIKNGTICDWHCKEIIQDSGALKQVSEH